MSRHLEGSATLDSTVGDLLDDVLSAMDALVSHQRTSPVSHLECFLLGGAIAHITADLTTLADTLCAGSALPAGLPAQKLLRAELKKSNTAASAYQFAASHYDPGNCSARGR